MPTMDILALEPMDTQDLDILDITGPGLMAIHTPMVPILTRMDPTPTMLLARGLLILMLSLLLTLTMVPMDTQDLDILDSMEPDLLDTLPVLTPMDHMPMDPTPTMLLARGLLMLSPP